MAINIYIDEKGYRMKEILGNNLKKFFNIVDPHYSEAEITYSDYGKYEVWEVSDKLFEKMCNMSEEKFEEISGEGIWWCSSEGSVLGCPDTYFTVKDAELLAWDSPIYSSKKGHDYSNLTEYLCDCLGASSSKNVCALATDLALYNNMKMSELFDTYEKHEKMKHGYQETNKTKR